MKFQFLWNALVLGCIGLAGCATENVESEPVPDAVTEQVDEGNDLESKWIATSATCPNAKGLMRGSAGAPPTLVECQAWCRTCPRSSITGGRTTLTFQSKSEWTCHCGIK